MVPDDVSVPVTPKKMLASITCTGAIPSVANRALFDGLLAVRSAWIVWVSSVDVFAHELGLLFDGLLVSEEASTAYRFGNPTAIQNRGKRERIA
jgi:hypothetical protein